ncbi:hypothetical protein [Streptomyces sp. NPDC096152]|uniref:hypothetical protein n=1 Tax=Streptomyces sp. NPDC096152 TaxID=3366078 RepID=UPI00380DBBC8
MIFGCEHDRPRDSCVICATNDNTAAVNDAARAADHNAQLMQQALSEQQGELQRMRQDIRTAADQQRRMAEQQYELNMTTHWEAHLTREATSQGLDPATVVREARAREQREIAAAEGVLGVAKAEYDAARVLRDGVSVGVLSGPVAALVRIFWVVMSTVLLNLGTNPLGELLAVLVGSAAGVAFISRRRADMEEVTRVLGMPLPAPAWSMAGAAATGVAWCSVFAAGTTEDCVSLALLNCIFYVPITFAVRASVKKKSPAVAAADLRLGNAAREVIECQDQLALVKRHPAVKYGLVAPVAQV